MTRKCTERLYRGVVLTTEARGATENRRRERFFFTGANGGNGDGGAFGTNCDLCVRSNFPGPKSRVKPDLGISKRPTLSAAAFCFGDSTVDC